jgi:hypothetical protein
MFSCFPYELFQVLDSSGSVVITKPKATWTTTLGLVVHAAADGIALGKHVVTSHDRHVCSIDNNPIRNTRSMLNETYERI